MKNKEFKILVKSKKVKILSFGPPQKDLKDTIIEVMSTGYITDENELAAIYSAADMFILPSLEDNLPNTMLESMACGTPVLSFNKGGMPDLITNGITGYICTPFNTEEFGERILKIIFNKNIRNRISVNCRQLIEEKFKLIDQAQNYLTLFDDLLKNRKAMPLNKGKTYTGIPSKNGEIILDKWHTDVPKNLFNIYREEALKLIDEIQKKWKTFGKNRTTQPGIIERQLKGLIYGIVTVYRSFILGVKRKL